MPVTLYSLFAFEDVVHVLDTMSESSSFVRLLIANTVTLYLNDDLVGDIRVCCHEVEEQRREAELRMYQSNDSSSDEELRNDLRMDIARNCDCWQCRVFRGGWDSD